MSGRISVSLRRTVALWNRCLEQMDHVFKDGNGEKERVRRERIEQALFAEASVSVIGKEVRSTANV